MKADIAILGAGPSGLLLARLLEVNKISCVVFERDGSPNSIGQGGTLDIHENSGQLALKEAGLLEIFEAKARYDAQRFVVVDHHGNDVLQYDSTDSKSRPELDRKDLRALLLDSVPKERIRWGYRVKKVLRENNSMSVQFENGCTESGFRLVIGADGTWSKVRELVTSAKPQYSGLSYLQASFGPEDEIYADLVTKAGKGMFVGMGEGKQVTAQCQGDGSYNSYIGLRLPEDWERPSDAQLRNDLLETFNDWKPELRNIVAHCKSFHVWRLWALEPKELSWQTVPGVALIGDAAHASTPFQGEGVNQAMTDSMELAREILRYGLDHLDEAVAAYEKAMFPRAIDYIERCDAAGKLMFAQDSPNGFKEILAGHEKVDSKDEVNAIKAESE